MDQALRERFTSKLSDYAKVEWLDPNKPLTVLEYIEGNVTSLGNIWSNIEANLPAIYADASKDAARSLHAYYEAVFLLEQLQRAESKTRQAEKMKKVLELVDEAIVRCPHSSSKQLARLYAFRSQALFEWSQKELAVVAIKRALQLDPYSVTYDALAARYLTHLEKPQEALRHIKRAMDVSAYPRAIEEAANTQAGPDETVSVSNLRQMYFEIKRNVNRVSGCGVSASPPSDGSLDSFTADSDSYDSDQDDTAEEQQAKEPLDPYETPYSEGPKNLTVDYRCTMQGQANVGKGRYYTASEMIERDTPILKERCYSIVILPEMVRRRCHYCTRNVTNRFWPCAGCTHAVYCAPQCAKLDWTLSHRFDCLLAKYWSDKSKSTFHVFRLLNRLGIKSVLEVIGEKLAKEEEPEVSGHLQSKSSANVYDIAVYSRDTKQRFTPDVEKKSSNLERQQYCVQMSLLSHSEKYSADYLCSNMTNAIECAVMACISQGFKFEQIRREQLLELIGHSFTSIRRVLTNAFRWSAPNERGIRVHIATCYLLVSSMFNHSCDPNAQWAIRSGYLTMTTTRDIEPGCEITISYGPNTSDYFEERQKRLFEGYFFQCNCSLCIEDCRRVPALKCMGTSCKGPVLANPDHNSADSRCLICAEPYPNARDKLELLKRARSEVAINAQLLLFSAIDRPTHLASIRQSLEQIIGLSYPSSNLLVESIYLVCKVLRSEGFLADCLHFGAIVDELLPLKHNTDTASSASLVIADAELAKQADNGTSAAYTTPAALDANIEHLIFWCSVYRSWIERTECKEEKQWQKILRFYRRLRVMLKSTIAYKERLFTELGPKAKETFETVGLREEINVLNALKWYKHQELERLKKKFAGQLRFQLDGMEA